MLICMWSLPLSTFTYWLLYSPLIRQFTRTYLLNQDWREQQLTGFKIAIEYSIEPDNSKLYKPEVLLFSFFCFFCEFELLGFYVYLWLLNYCWSCRHWFLLWWALKSFQCFLYPFLENRHHIMSFHTRLHSMSFHYFFIVLSCCILDSGKVPALWTA